jgi:hypothetical protein
MAIVSRMSVDKAKSVKKAVKRGLTQRLRQRVGLGDSSDSSGSDSDSDDEGASTGTGKIEEKDSDAGSEKKGGRKRKTKKGQKDIEMGNAPVKKGFTTSNLEQSFPADAELTRESVDQVTALVCLLSNQLTLYLSTCKALGTLQSCPWALSHWKMSWKVSVLYVCKFVI